MIVPSRSRRTPGREHPLLAPSPPADVSDTLPPSRSSRHLTLFSAQAPQPCGNKSTEGLAVIHRTAPDVLHPLQCLMTARGRVPALSAPERTACALRATRFKGECERLCAQGGLQGDSAVATYTGQPTIAVALSRLTHSRSSRRGD